MNKVDLISGISLMLVGGLLIFIVIPLETQQGTSFGLTPTFFPTLLATGMSLCALGLAVQAGLRLRSGADSAPVPITWWNLLMFTAAAVLVLGGIVAIDFFGIIAAGPALIAALMLFLGERNVIRIALTATLPVAAIYILAIHVLRTPLP